MKLETILNAMEKSYLEITGYNPQKHYSIASRQYRAFRDRIIRMDERQKMRIAKLEAEVEQWQKMYRDDMGV